MRPDQIRAGDSVLTPCVCVCVLLAFMYYARSNAPMRHVRITEPGAECFTHSHAPYPWLFGLQYACAGCPAYAFQLCNSSLRQSEHTSTAASSAQAGFAYTSAPCALVCQRIRVGRPSPVPTCSLWHRTAAKMFCFLSGRRTGSVHSMRFAFASHWIADGGRSHNCSDCRG